MRRAVAPCKPLLGLRIHNFCNQFFEKMYILTTLSTLLVDTLGELYKTLILLLLLLLL